MIINENVNDWLRNAHVLKWINEFNKWLVEVKTVRNNAVCPRRQDRREASKLRRLRRLFNSSTHPAAPFRPHSTQLNSTQLNVFESVSYSRTNRPERALSTIITWRSRHFLLFGFSETTRDTKPRSSFEVKLVAVLSPTARRSSFVHRRSRRR